MSPDCMTGRRACQPSVEERLVSRGARPGRRRRRCGAGSRRPRSRAPAAARRSGGRSADTPAPAPRADLARRRRRIAAPPSGERRAARRRSRRRCPRSAAPPGASRARPLTGKPCAAVIAKSAAIGVSRFSGTTRRARSTTNGPGRISVRIDSALMPGSKTPKPPGSQIQAWSGCQRRTSSFQTMATERGGRVASQALASATAGAKRECQVAKRTTPAAAGGGDHEVDLAEGRRRRLLQQDVAPGGERLAAPWRCAPPAARRAPPRPADPSARKRSRSGKFGTPSIVAWRETRGDELEVRVGGDRRDVLVAGDLADADQRDREGRGHQCELPAHRAAAAALEEVEVGAGVGPADVVVVELDVAAVRTRHRRRPGREPARRAPRRRRRDAAAGSARRARSCRRSRTTASGPPRAASGAACSTTVP